VTLAISHSDSHSDANSATLWL